MTYSMHIITATSVIIIYPMRVFYLMAVKNEKDVNYLLADGIETYVKFLVTSDDGAKYSVLRKFVIKPKGGIPPHVHPNSEHIQYVLKGEMIVGIKDKEYRVGLGDCYCIPEGTKHWYYNDTNEDVEFLCIVPNKNIETVFLEDEFDERYERF